MYCQKCGTQLPNGSAFCSVCGQKLPTTGAPPPYAPLPQPMAAAPAQMQNRKMWNAQKRGSKKPLFIIIACVLVLAVTLLFVLNPFNTRPDNALAVTYDSVKSFLLATGFDVMLETNNGYYNSYKYDLSLLLGRDINSSVLDVELRSGGSNYTDRQFILNGIAYRIYGTDIENPDNYSANHLNSWDEWNDADELVKDSHFDLPAIYDYMDDIYKSHLRDYYGISIGSVEGMLNIVENFLYVECQKENVLKNIVGELVISSASGLNRYEYSLDYYELFSAFEDYLDDISGDDSYIEKYKLESRDLRAWSGILSLISPQDISRNMAKVDIALVTSGARVLQTLEMEFINVYAELIAVSLTVDAYNDSEMDVAALRELAEEIG